MPERVYDDGEALIRYGERGDEMYLLRYGKVGGDGGEGLGRGGRDGRLGQSRHWSNGVWGMTGLRHKG